MHLPTAWPVLKGSWTLSSLLYLDPRTRPSPHPLKTPPLPLAQTHPSWDWGPAEPRWIQSWTVRPWMTEKGPTKTETQRTWKCLRKRPRVLQQRVGANSDEVNFSRSAINTAWLGFGSLQCMSLIVMLFLIADGKKEKNSTTADKAAKGSKVPSTATKPAKSNSAQSAPLTPMAVNMEKVDLGKISSILSSLTSAMKSTGMFRHTEQGHGC